MGTRIEDVVALAGQLPEVTRHERDRWSRLDVRGTAFGYVWPATQTAGLKQTLADQLGLVAERPEVFEVQYTSGGFGWVVVHLAAVERDELAELVLDAWRLSAPVELAQAHGDDLPT